MPNIYLQNTAKTTDSSTSTRLASKQNSNEKKLFRVCFLKYYGHSIFGETLYI